MSTEKKDQLIFSFLISLIDFHSSSRHTMGKRVHFEEGSGKPQKKTRYEDDPPDEEPPSASSAASQPAARSGTGLDGKDSDEEEEDDGEGGNGEGKKNMDEVKGEWIPRFQTFFCWVSFAPGDRNGLLFKVSTTVFCDSLLASLSCWTARSNKSTLELASGAAFHPPHPPSSPPSTADVFRNCHLSPICWSSWQSSALFCSSPSVPLLL